MIDRRLGKIIVLSGEGAGLPRPNFSAYTHMTDQILHAGERAGWKAQEEALELRVTGGIAPEKQIQLALFLASERSNHVSGKLIHVNDDWKRLETSSVNPELYTLRRVQKV
jgi:3-oxoacyl-[acyl-carrier protein] reductase